MKDTNSVITIVVAVAIGMLVGNSIGTTKNIETNTAQRLAELTERVDAMSGVPDALAALQQETAQLGADLGKVGEDLAKMGTGLAKVDADLARVDAGMADTSGAIGGLAERLDRTDGRIAALGDAMAQPPAEVSPAPAVETREDAAPATPLADSLGDTAIVLAVGETGSVGEQRIFLSRLMDGGARLHVVGHGAMDAMVDEAPAALGNGCEIGLAGVEGGKAYLMPRCDAAAVAAPAAKVDQPDGPLELRVGETGAVGEQRVFLSRLMDDTAHVMIVGRGMAEIGMAAAVDLGNGCALRLTAAGDGAAVLAPEC